MSRADGLRFGLHAGQQFPTFEPLLRLWRLAEASGYDWVSLFDHLRPPIFGPTGPCLESTTSLAALAASVPRVRCALLVGCPTWRHPAVLAAAATTIDHVSGGRLELGLGVGSADDAYAEWGIAQPPYATRLAVLDETCAILRGLWERDAFSHQGEHYTFREAHLVPKPVQTRVPLVIGGSGGGLLRLAGRHADRWNSLVCPLPAYARRMATLGQACRAAGRDPSDVRASLTFRVVLGRTDAHAAGRADLMWSRAGTPIPDRREFLVVGGPATVAAALQPYVDLGVRDLLLACRPAPIRTDAGDTYTVDTYTVEAFTAEVVPRLRTR